ncbi:MAG: leucyl aminopeptidase family protein [Alphaproteobacteria bacterium]|nr:leucyl aminopeptidase family protein [Alphaproteobacteria bacterium]
MPSKLLASKFADANTPSVAIIVLASDKLAGWLETQPSDVQAWVARNKFRGKLGECLTVPVPDAEPFALFGWGDASARTRGRFHFAAAAKGLPTGCYHIKSGLTQDETFQSALAWLQAGYRFERYKSASHEISRLIAPENIDAAYVEALAKAEFLTRDLINTPTSDMGPDQLEEQFQALATEFSADATTIKGDDLIAENLPMIHAVGRASAQQPRLLDMRWGDAADPKVTLVGKGVCFDTGGLNIKPGASMGLMKKDMGGAATVLGLARIIMSQNLPVRLRVLVPAVENSISAEAFRPGDVLTSRKGLTVEVNNTDAEGRLVLADALALADEEAPDYLFCMATLTGAARVALGPDVVPFYTDDDALSHRLARSGRAIFDPLWRMPFWSPYETMIEPEIADLDNAPSGGFAGSITAALFLRRFVERATHFAHFDIYGWNPTARPGHPKGAAFQGARAIFEVLRQKAEA